MPKNKAAVDDMVMTVQQGLLCDQCRLSYVAEVQVFLVAVDRSGNVQPGVSVLQGIVTPDTLAPTFTFLNFTSPMIDQNTGLFSMNMMLNTSLPAVVYLAMYRYAEYMQYVSLNAVRC